MKTYIRHDPFRGSNVEAWLKARRDTYDKPGWLQDSAWSALDDLLEEYRLCADTGAALDVERPESPS